MFHWLKLYLKYFKYKSIRLAYITELEQDILYKKKKQELHENVIPVHFVIPVVSIILEKLMIKVRILN